MSWAFMTSTFWICKITVHYNYNTIFFIWVDCWTQKSKIIVIPVNQVLEAAGGGFYLRIVHSDLASFEPVSGFTRLLCGFKQYFLLRPTAIMKKEFRFFHLLIKALCF